MRTPKPDSPFSAHKKKLRIIKTASVGGALNKMGQNLTESAAAADNNKSGESTPRMIEEQKSLTIEESAEPTEWDNETIGQNELRDDILQINNEFKVLGVNLDKTNSDEKMNEEDKLEKHKRKIS